MDIIEISFSHLDCFLLEVFKHGAPSQGDAPGHMGCDIGGSLAKMAGAPDAARQLILLEWMYSEPLLNMEFFLRQDGFLD